MRFCPSKETNHPSRLGRLERAHREKDGDDEHRKKIRKEIFVHNILLWVVSGLGRTVTSIHRSSKRIEGGEFITFYFS